MAGSVLDLLTNPNLLRDAKEEHHRRLCGREYKRDSTIEPPLDKARELAKTYTGKK
jgi:hypothetical protein